MTHVSCLDRVGLGLHPQHDVHDVAERDVRRMGSVPTTPADMIPRFARRRPLVSFFIVDAHRNEILLRYFGTPDDRSIQVNGQIVYARFFTTAPGRDDFHSKSCLYKSRLLLPVNVCVFIIVPTFDGAGHAGYQEIYAKGYCSNVMLRKSKRSTLATALGAASLLI